MFLGSRNPLLIFLQSRKFDLPCLGDPKKIQVDFRFNTYLEVLVIVSCQNFWNFFTMFLRSGNPLLTFLLSYHVWVTSKIQVTFPFKTYSEVLVNVSYRFLKFLDYSCFWVKNPLLIFLQSYHVWVTSKIQVDFRFNTYSEVLVIVSCRVLKFLHYSCFWGQGILCWHSYWATISWDLENSGHVQEVLKSPKHSFFTDKNALNS